MADSSVSLFLLSYHGNESQNVKLQLIIEVGIRLT